MTLNKNDEIVLKSMLNAKSNGNFVDIDNLSIPAKVSNEQIEDSLEVLSAYKLISILGKDYGFQILPDGLRYFDEKKSKTNSIVFWKFVYTPLAFILGAVTTLIINNLLK